MKKSAKKAAFGRIFLGRPIMKTTLATILIALALCLTAAAQTDWVIEYSNKKTLVVRHEGYVYQATCDGTYRYGAGFQFAAGDCGPIFGLHSIQPFEGEQWDKDGVRYRMWNVNETLALQRDQKDNKFGWVQTRFNISFMMTDQKRTAYCADLAARVHNQKLDHESDLKQAYALRDEAYTTGWICPPTK